MKFSYDPEADAVYFAFDKRRIEYAEELDDYRLLMIAADESVIGVELLYVSEGVDLRGLPHAAEIAEALGREGINVRVSDARVGEAVRARLKIGGGAARIPPILY